MALMHAHRVSVFSYTAVPATIVCEGDRKLANIYSHEFTVETADKNTQSKYKQKGIYESKPPASARSKDFAVQNPDKWMAFEVFGFPGKEMMRFVQMLLDEHYNRYYVPPDLETEVGREREQAVYETIGIACCGSMIGIAEVPAGMACYIRDLDGEEFVQWGES
ncbi:hypothetical protein Hypma_009437 [Hypsizygus marmoreus]|uniref:Uncharacterized protein n=1 Tax=Hypsizygus marmoreus TaxID=39966 RepID=A0A369JPV8_HYPMA|nr:hypothetical protein Hypma_009437 [Hypsizygus marmoreus]